MATLDEGVANLQRFISHLTASTGALETSAEHFQEAGRRFSELENEAGEQGDGLNGELEELASTLDSALPGALDALGELAQAAVEGQQSAGEAGHTVEEAGSELEQKADGTLDDLADAQARLLTQGFEALDRTLAESQSEIESQAQEAEQAFDQLESAVEGAQGEADAAWGAAEAELDESIAELGQGRADLEAAAAESVQGFDRAADEFEQHCSQLASEIDVIYDALDAEVDDQGEAWEQHAGKVAQEALAFVNAAAQERVEQPARLLEQDVLAALEQEYDALSGVLDAAADTARELDPLAEELARCQSVVAQIAELMNTLAE